MAQAQGTFHEGDVIGNRYRIKKILGTPGAMSQNNFIITAGRTEYFAKQLLSSHFSNPAEYISAKKTIKREAETLKRMRHPGIPLLIDYFEEDVGKAAGKLGKEKAFFIVSELVDGDSLETLLEKETCGKGFEEPKVLNIGMKLCEILNYCHNGLVTKKNKRVQILHRDIKPANIMKSPFNTLHLIDFGIAAQVMGPTQILLPYIGTPPYCPIEQYSNATAESTMDIYAFGATLYELATGIGIPEATERKKGTLIDYPRDKISSEFQKCLEGMLEMDKTLRTKTLGGVYARLEAVLKSHENKIFSYEQEYKFIGWGKPIKNTSSHVKVFGKIFEGTALESHKHWAGHFQSYENYLFMTAAHKISGTDKQKNYLAIINIEEAVKAGKILVPTIVELPEGYIRTMQVTEDILGISIGAEHNFKDSESYIINLEKWKSHCRVIGTQRLDLNEDYVESVIVPMWPTTCFQKYDDKIILLGTQNIAIHNVANRSQRLNQTIFPIKPDFEKQLQLEEPESCMIDKNELFTYGHNWGVFDLLEYQKTGNIKGNLRSIGHFPEMTCRKQWTYQGTEYTFQAYKADNFWGRCSFTPINDATRGEGLAEIIHNMHINMSVGCMNRVIAELAGNNIITQLDDKMLIVVDIEDWIADNIKQIPGTAEIEKPTNICISGRYDTPEKIVSAKRVGKYIAICTQGEKQRAPYLSIIEAFKTTPKLW